MASPQERDKQPFIKVGDLSGHSFLYPIPDFLAEEPPEKIAKDFRGTIEFFTEEEAAREVCPKCEAPSLLPLPSLLPF